MDRYPTIWRARVLSAVVLAWALVLWGLGPVSADQGPITCTPVTVSTVMNAAVAGQVACTSASGSVLTYAARPYVADRHGPANGKVVVDRATGGFTYTPGYYPPDPTRGGFQDRLPDWTGSDSFTVVATATDGTAVDTIVDVDVDAPPASCDAKFVAKTKTMFNDPSGSEAKQYQMLRHIVKMINCVPARNSDGSQASIKFSFYSLTYAPIQDALVQAMRRGVAVQALTNSHADKYAAWKTLAKNLGSNTLGSSFATTCWQGCITPRTPPAAGGPTAWYSAEATTGTSTKVVFTDRSYAGSSGRPIVNWEWDFGDGSGRVGGPGPHTHEYAAPGTYATSLMVTDSAGAKHTTTGSKTLPDNEEPMYPSLHSKIYLFSQVGTGANARSWVSGYSSGNPTYQQARKGFNNFNVAVGDKTLYTILANYFGDMVTASRGQLLTPNYFRSYSTPGNPATGAPATVVHLGPQTHGDINREILSSVKCKYKVGKKTKRTTIRVSMFVFTRVGLSRDIWRLAFEKGCNIDITYTQMSQRIKGPDGKWLANSDGEAPGYGVADCLATPPTRKVKGKAVVNTLGGPTKANPLAKYCHGTSLKGKVPVSKTGVWLNRKSSVTGGTLKVHMACPVAPRYDSVKKLWSLPCIRNDIFTHQKVMIVDGHIRGSVQKYVMAGSSNWSSPGLRASDEIITEIKRADTLYAQQLANMVYLDKIVTRNTARVTTASTDSAGDSGGMTTLSITGGRQLDVRGVEPDHNQE